MSADSRIEVTIAGIRLRIPICVDAKTTLALAQRVSERIKQIEAEASKIDTQAFALQAAMSFAAELEESRHDRVEETAQTLKALDSLAVALEGLASTYRIEDEQ